VAELERDGGKIDEEEELEVEVEDERDGSCKARKR
jgi:hypothetical protein